MDKHHHYDFEIEPVEEETEEQIERRRKIRASISIFLAILMLGWIIPYDVVGSLLASNTIDNYQLTTENHIIIFNELLLRDIQNYYRSHQLTELKLCLKGTIEDNTYTITSFYEPKILFATPISVHAIQCDEETLIDLHSHPFRNCLFSEQDISTYQRFKNTNTLGAVMCDLNRFSFYKA